MQLSKNEKLYRDGGRRSRPHPLSGGGERDRTDDILRARQALSQLSYTPEKSGGPGRT